MRDRTIVDGESDSPVSVSLLHQQIAVLVYRVNSQSLRDGSGIIAEGTKQRREGAVCFDRESNSTLFK